jgi:DUF4097 and DUF4098 domain-containing protein YvlB
MWWMSEFDPVPNLSAMGALLSSERIEGVIMRRSFRWSIFALGLLVIAVPAYAVDYSEEKVFNAVPGGRLTVDASFHDVVVTATPGDEVRIRVDLSVGGSGAKAERRMARLKPTYEVDRDGITVRSVEKSSGWSWGSSRTDGRIQVWLPPVMDVVVDNASGDADLEGDFGDAALVVNNSSGRVRLEGAARSFEVDNSSGGTEARVTRPLEDFSVDCSSGSVRLFGGAYHAHVDTSSGSIELNDLRGGATMDASSGSIHATWASVVPDMNVDADTSSGSVTLVFPPGTDLNGRVDTSSGGIRSDFGGSFGDDRDSLRLEGGDGSVRLRVDTSSGGVRLLDH